MKKTLRNQLSAAVAMLVVAAIALTGATYAWFTSIANPDVESIDLYVKASDSIMFSALAEPEIDKVDDWKITVTKDEITGALRGNQANAFPTNMLNVSTLFNSTSSDFFTASHTNQGDLNGYIATTQPNNYAKFSLWVKSTRDGYIYLDAGSLVAAVSGDQPKSAIANTVRVGIVPVDGLGDEEWANAVIWEPNSKGHLSTDFGGPGGTTKLATSAVKNAVAVDDFASLAAAVAAQTTFDFQEDDTNITDDATKIGLFNLSMDTMKKFNVYIWVEGADSDTVNAVAKSNFLTYLKFGQAYDLTLS